MAITITFVSGQILKHKQTTSLVRKEMQTKATMNPNVYYILKKT